MEDFLEDHISNEDLYIPVNTKRGGYLFPLELPPRIENALIRANIKFVGQLLDISEDRLFSIRGIGQKSIPYLRALKRRLTDFFSQSEGVRSNSVLEHDEHDENKNTPSQTLSVTSFSRPSQPFNVTKNDPLYLLGLPARAENALKRADINSAGQLWEIPKDKLFAIRRMGQKSLSDIMTVKEKLNAIFGEPVATDDNDTENDTSYGKTNSSGKTSIKPFQPPLQVRELIPDLLSRCWDDRSRTIIIRRYGLQNGNRETLEEIGKSLGVTRERIRQIQLRSLRRMRHYTTRSREPLINLVSHLLWEHDGLISDEEANKYVPQVLETLEYDGSSILDLFAGLGWIWSCGIGGVKIYSPSISGYYNLDDVVDKITVEIRMKPAGIGTDELAELLPCSRYTSGKEFERRKFISRFCLLDPRIEEITQGVFGPYLRAGTRKTGLWASLIERVLRNEGYPLHFTEISEKVNGLIKDGDQHLDPRRLHSLLIENEEFAHTGIRGTYGLTEWGIRKESTPELIDECLNKAGFPLHWEQIFQYVSKYKNSKMASIRSILDNRGKYKKLGNGLYCHTRAVNVGYPVS